MGNDLDSGMTLLTRLIARRGRNRAYFAALLIACGSALIAYWNSDVRQNAFVERELTIHRVVGAVGAILVISAVLRLVRGIREALGPTEHPAYLGIERGELKAIVEDVGSASTINFVVGELFETFDANRDERATLSGYLRQRFPPVRFEQIATVVTRL